MVRSRGAIEDPVPVLSDDELLALALSRPNEALVHARAVLAGDPSPWQASVAHQAVGIVLRDFGDIGEALRELRLGIADAGRTGTADRVADVRGTYGVALVMAGRTRQGLAQIEQAIEARTTGTGRGRDLIRRASVRWLLGRHPEALEDADEAVTLLAGDPVWEARALTHRAMQYLAMGALVRSERDYLHAEALFEASGQRLELADARQERGAVAFARGDLPSALARFGEAEELVEELGVFEPELVINKCAVLLTAGLAAEAHREAEAGLDRSVRQRTSATRRAELLYTTALTARAAGDAVLAERRSREALTLFTRQGRPGWAARADLVLVQSRYAGGDRSARLLTRVDGLPARLDPVDVARIAEAHLLAGRLALERRRDDVARGHLSAAGRYRGNDLHAGIAAHVARAVQGAHDGRTRGMLAACAAGLATIDLHLRTLGATELRAQATILGSELAGIALRHAARRSDPAQLLAWSERWRSVALTVPPVRPGPDSTLVGELAALRGLAGRLEQAESPPAALVQEYRRREDRVRQIVRATPGNTRPRHAVSRTAMHRLHDLLAGRALIELIELDGALRAVVVHQGRLRDVVVGDVATADRAVEHALFVLRRGIRGPARQAASRTRSGTGAALDLTAVGARMERALLGDVAAWLPPGAPLVVVPTGRWHAVPWSMMPSLADRPVSVAPSAATWMRAAGVREPVHRRVVVVGGPGLSTGEREVRELAALHRRAVVLAGEDATVERVLAAMDGAWLVHVAAHGRFRSDSPLFSSIGLHDGPLTGYDLERLAVPPYRVLLSCCDSALGGRSGADELLGLTSALTALGCAGVMGTVVPVDDPATVPLMTGLHHGLLAGMPLPEALAAARTGVDGAAARATADAFVALGV